MNVEEVVVMQYMPDCDRVAACAWEGAFLGEVIYNCHGSAFELFQRNALIVATRLHVDGQCSKVGYV